ncbi:MAG: hypothetical protein RBS48_04130, partial [Ignavibacteriaceae bacterium]|nr:hypothetical protein [Ignavibacteriaceae bacterium]
MLLKFMKILLMASFVSIISVEINFAQLNDYVSNVTTSPQREGFPIHIKADLRNSTSISELTLAYRTFGMTEYI